MGVGMLAALLGSVPIGILVDRIGRLATIRAAALVAVASLLVLIVAHGAAGVGSAMAVRSLAVAAYMSAEFAYASATISSERSVSAVGALGMIGNLSFALSPALGAALWQHGIGRAPFG
jgi:MFS family permease